MREQEETARSESMPGSDQHLVRRAIAGYAILAGALIFPPILDLILSGLGFVSNIDAILWLYPLVGAIGALVGAGEILGRYRDEPFLALAQSFSLLYQAVNAAAAMAAFYLIGVFGWNFGISGEASSAVTQVLVAGFGSMALLRSSLFSARVGDNDVQVGPATVLQTVLNAADAEVDRASAGRRARAAREIMSGVDAGKAKDTLPLFCYRLTQSSLSDSDWEVMNQKIDNIYDPDSNDRSQQSKVYTLGVILMNYLGKEALQAAVEVLDSEIAIDGDEAAVEDIVRDYYEAVKVGDFERAYSYFGSTYRSVAEKETWIENQRSSGVTDATVTSLKVDDIESQATATADVSFRGNGSTPPSHITWKLVREGGEWKLDSQTPPPGPLG